MMPSEKPALPPTSELFERYAAMVYRRCREILRLDEAARDAVQEIFLRVVEKRDSFRGEAAPSTWLYRAATLYCLQRLRDRERHRLKLETFAASAQAPFTESREDHLTLLRLLDGETEQVRLMVWLRYVDGLSMEEVAEVVGRSRKTVSQRVRRFASVVRAELQLNEEAP